MGAVNLALEKMERITLGGKDRGEIRGKIGKVAGVVVDAATKASLGKKDTEHLVDGGR